MGIKYYIDNDGNYKGSLEGIKPPAEWTEVAIAPDHAEQKWDGSKWLDLVLTLEQQMSEINIDPDLENIIDALDPPTRDRIATETMGKYNAKKLLKSQKP